MPTAQRSSAGERPGLMRRLLGTLLPSRRRSSYLLAALLLHLLVVGALLYIGLRVPIPSPPLPRVVVELLPAVESKPLPQEPITPVVPMSEPAAAPPPVVPPSQGQAEVLPLVENGIAAAVAAVDAVTEPLPYTDAALPQEPLPPIPATIPSRAVASITVADARQRWEFEILQYLESHKQYPAMAQFLGQEDAISVRLRVDREGRVLAQRIVSSRGYRRLDDEVMALIARANPLPPPPLELSEQDLEFRVAIAFSIVAAQVP